MDLQIVEFIQSFRTELLDLFFSLVTELGDETAFIVITGILYWSVDKKFGYRFAMVFLGSVLLNESLKALIARPRPFNKSSVDSVVEPTEGFSMPSGHAQNSTIQAWLLHEHFASLYRWVRPALILFVILVSFSRVYLGQHYISDVLAGIAVASIYYVGVTYVMSNISTFNKYHYLVLSLALGLILIILPEKNVWITVAGMVGGTLGYRLEQRYVKFEVQSTFLQHGVKFILGIAITLAIQEGLKFVLPYGLFESELFTLTLDFIRYMFIVMWVTLGAPLLFKMVFKTKAA